MKMKVSVGMTLWATLAFGQVLQMPKEDGGCARFPRTLILEDSPLAFSKIRLEGSRAVLESSTLSGLSLNCEDNVSQFSKLPNAQSELVRDDNNRARGRKVTISKWIAIQEFPEPANRGDSGMGVAAKLVVASLIGAQNPRQKPIEITNLQENPVRTKVILDPASRQMSILDPANPTQHFRFSCGLQGQMYVEVKTGDRFSLLNVTTELASDQPKSEGTVRCVSEIRFNDSTKKFSYSMSDFALGVPATSSQDKVPQAEPEGVQ